MALYVRPRGDGHAIVAVSRRVDNTVYVAITVAAIVVIVVVVTIAVLHDGVFSTVN